MHNRIGFADSASFVSRSRECAIRDIGPLASLVWRTSEVSVPLGVVWSPGHQLMIFTVRSLNCGTAVVEVV
jgi:hypothetical protein